MFQIKLRKRNRICKTEYGFVLLYAVLVASIVLSIGIGIYNIILKELLISSSSRDSQLSFYAADAGVECALYWDIRKKLFATSTSNFITCANTNMMVGGGTVSTFALSLSNGACVDVMVNKSSQAQTIVTSRGHNTCNLSDPRRVERALRVTY